MPMASQRVAFRHRQPGRSILDRVLIQGLIQQAMLPPYICRVVVWSCHPVIRSPGRPASWKQKNPAPQAITSSRTEYSVVPP